MNTNEPQEPMSEDELADFMLNAKTEETIAAAKKMALEFCGKTPIV